MNSVKGLPKTEDRHTINSDHRQSRRQHKCRHEYLPGDRPTLGFGTTHGVKLADVTDPVRAVQRALTDISQFEGAAKECIAVPLHQHEYDAFIQLSYNIGTTAFCRSTLVRKVNACDYAGACAEILRWNRFKGRPLPGLTAGRKAEHQRCIGSTP